MPDARQTTRPPAGPGAPVWAVMSARRRAHVERVAVLTRHWAEAMELPVHEAGRWLRAVWLHDALRDQTPDALAGLVPGAPEPSGLLHGPASAARAEAEGERDQGVLLAVRFHSLGHPEWDMVGKTLYCADYLEPGRKFDREERAELAGRYPSAPDEVLLEVARRRLRNLVDKGWMVPESTWRFWNGLAASRG